MMSGQKSRRTLTNDLNIYVFCNVRIFFNCIHFLQPYYNTFQELMPTLFLFLYEKNVDFALLYRL